MSVRFFLSLLAAATFTLSATSTLAEVEPDISRTYLCSHCNDQDAARAFIEARIGRRCETQMWSSPGEPGPGDIPDLQLCYGPDEQAVVLNPETRVLYSFIIRRDSNANRGEAASVETVVLSEQERQKQQGGWDTYLEWQDMLDALSEHMTEWVKEHRVPNWSYACPLSGDDEDLVCPSGTALEALSDPELYDSMEEEAREYAIEQYEQRFAPDEDPGVVVSQGWLSLTTPILEGGITLDRAELEREDYPSAYEVDFYWAEDPDQTVTWMDPPDQLWFDFMAQRGANGSVGVVTMLNLEQSRLLGEQGWALGDQDRDAMDECTEARMERAVAHGRFDDPSEPDPAFLDELEAMGGSVVRTILPKGSPLTCFHMVAKTEDGETIREWIRCF